MEFDTKAIHVGQEPEELTGSVIPPIFATSTYAQRTPGEHSGFDYSRTDNPTRSVLHTVLASLEGVEPGDPGGAVATASGMAATALIGYLLRPGDHVVISDDVYGGTYRFFARVLGEQGIAWSVADLTDRHALAAAIRPTTRLVWVETPTNPLLHVVDLDWAVTAAHDNGAWVCVDNTFATPYLQQPLAHGADFVLHSTTKYIGGHSDLVGGAIVVGDAELLERLRFLQNAAGPVPSPFDCYLVLRGLKTLGIRMERHCSNAAAIADFLSGHAAVEEVFYPGLGDHPQHEVAVRQMRGFGGMVAFVPTGGIAAARRIGERTELFVLAESLGGVESLIEVPSLMTHTSVAGTALEVPEALVRLSVGIEHPDDLIADLDAALG